MDEDNLSDDDIPLLVQLAPPAPLNQDELSKVPVTILTGFLGSGKTTLINYILRSPNHGKRIAVIENEYSGGASLVAAERSSILTGSTNEQGALLSIETLIARDGTDDSNLTDLIELPNGCICCTVKDNLVSALDNLLQKKRDLDYIIIETSGMANPGPIASIFWLDENIESRIRLDGIVACVDARNIIMQLKETKRTYNETENSYFNGDEAAQQIAYADRIVLNKIDLCEESKLIRVISELRAINSTAPIRKTIYSQIPDLEWVLDADCFNPALLKEIDAWFRENPSETCQSPSCKFCFGMTSGQSLNFCYPCAIPRDDHIHTTAITSIALIERGSVCLKRMNLWLATILWPNQDRDNYTLTSLLRELETLNLITTPESMENKWNDEAQSKVFRIKGVLSAFCTEEEDCLSYSEDGIDRRKYILQAVNDLWDIRPTSSTNYWTRGDDRVCKLVIIGRNLNKDLLISGFKSCFK